MAQQRAGAESLEVKIAGEAQVRQLESLQAELAALKQRLAAHRGSVWDS